jgi:hypothetical protein
MVVLTSVMTDEANFQFLAWLCFSATSDQVLLER